MAFRDRLGGKGLLTGALGGGRIGGALSGVGDILQESFGGLGSGGIFGGKQRARRRADAAAQEADLAQASDPSLQVDTVDTIDSTGLGTVGMNEIAMQDPMLGASVNNRQFTPYSKKGTPKFWPKTTKDQYHSSGDPETMTSEESGETVKTENVDEGEFSKIHYKIPERPFVRAQSTSDKYQEGEKFWLND